MIDRAFIPESLSGILFSEKFRVPIANAEDHKAVQEKLFQFGCGWHNGNPELLDSTCMDTYFDVITDLVVGKTGALSYLIEGDEELSKDYISIPAAHILNAHQRLVVRREADPHDHSENSAMSQPAYSEGHHAISIQVYLKDKEDTSIDEAVNQLKTIFAPVAKSELVSSVLVEISKMK